MTWYLIISAIVGIVVLAGVAYGHFTARDTDAAGEFDTLGADAPVRHEAGLDFEQPRTRDRHTTVR